MEAFKRASSSLRRLVGGLRPGTKRTRPLDSESSYSRLALRLERDLEPGERGRALLVAAADDDNVGLEAVTELAWYLAQQLGHTVLLVDGTFGRRVLTDGFHVGEAPGLMDLIAEPDVTVAALRAASLATEHESIRLLPRGHGDNGRTIPARSDALRRLMAVACDGYDFVVVMGSLADASSRSLAFGAFVDAALLVAVEGRSNLEAVERGQRLLNECGAERVGLVLASPPEASPHADG